MDALRMKHSIILTVHNKDWLLEQVLAGIINNTSGIYELILVLDGCSDNSQQVAERYLNSVNKEHKMLFTPDVFETKANNAGLRTATGDYCIIVQDDCVITDPEWNLRMQKPFAAFSDVHAVSGNCAHNYQINPNSRDVSLDYDPEDHWQDIIIDCDHAMNHNTARDKFYIRNTANRGPLMFDHQILEKLNYLDESFAPQDMDDHEFNHRAYQQLGKVCGFYGISFRSDNNWGGTRINGGTPAWLHKSNQKNTKIIYNRYKDIINLRHDETRELP